jgi:predicted RNase H-like HicB family nuclease
MDVIFMRLQLIIEVLKKGNWYLARTPELDFISQGKTQEEAKRNLLEVIKIQFSEMKEMGTLSDFLLECGFEIKENEIISKTEMVGFEKSVVPV